MIREGGGKHEPTEAELELQAGELFRDTCKRMAHILWAFEIPGTEKEIFEYLHAEYDPKLFRYKETLFTALMAAENAPFDYPEEDSEHYEEWRELMTYRADDQERLFGKLGFQKDIFSNSLALVRALGLLNRDLSGEDPRKSLEKKLAQRMSDMIEESGLERPEHFKFLPKPKTEEISLEEDLEIQEKSDERKERFRNEILELHKRQGVHPKIAESLANEEVSELLKMIKEGDLSDSDIFERELKEMFQDPDYMDLYKIADLIIGTPPA